MSDGLRGRTVLLVGTESRVAALERRLGESGATVVPFPTVRTAPPANPDPLDRALRRWRSYDWVVFTSSNGVDHVVSRAASLGISFRSNDGPRVAAVGPATRVAAEAAGLLVDAMPSEYLTDAIADAIGPVRGRRILLPRSSLARQSLADILRSRGASVDAVDAYESLPASPDLATLTTIARVDVIVFTSASAARNLASMLPASTLDRIRELAIAVCIGPVTAEAAGNLGFRVALVAEEHTVPGIVRTLREMTVDG
ncbi:MAG TPA: uroporphyrinogen-III synthase [Thermoplasmata archaeon]|nr:uroporphyrinogen-III synthase [Thermoplasmata archaeon]